MVHRLPLALALVLATSLATRADPARDLTIVLGGDIALPTGPNDAAIDALGPHIFDDLRPYLDQADLAFANLEAPFTRRATTVEKTFPMTSPPERLAWIIAAGFDLFSLANNHFGDAGAPGVDDTLTALAGARDARGGALWWAGAASDPRRALDGITFTPPGKSLVVALLALGNGSAKEVAHLPSGPAQRARVVARVRALAAASDLLIVSLHGGSEYRHALDADLASLARALVDAGADVVVAHHPHVVRGLERRGHGLILFGVGNLAFATMTERHRSVEASANPSVPHEPGQTVGPVRAARGRAGSHQDRGATLWGMLPILRVVDGRLADLRIVPLWVDNAYPLELPGLAPFPAAALQPRVLTGAYAQAALSFIDGLCAGTRTVLRRQGDEAVLDLSR